MQFFIENETEVSFDFDVEAVVKAVVEEVLDSEQCPYEAQVNVLLTDNEGIRQFNKEYRDIDRETDVLSFPNLDFEEPGFYEIDEEMEAAYFDPESGELILGDIIISVDKVMEQAQNYGHSKKREFAFLVAHSMLHLAGCDHMEPEEAAIMEAKQEAVLAKLNITRD